MELNIKTKDNTKLHVIDFAIAQPKAVVAIVHGFGEHSGRYTHWANYFNQAGFACIGFDLRGHGKSEGKRGYVPKFDIFWDDLDYFLAEVQTRYPALPVILYGHSLGGCIVLSYLVNRKPRLAAVVATSSFIRLAFKPSPILVALGKFTNLFYPAFTQKSDLDTKHLSRDAKVVSDYENDPLVHGDVSSGLGIGMLIQGEQLAHYQGHIETPLLLTHGAQDQVTSPEGTKAFYQNTTGNRTLKIWENLYHETHNEPEQKEVFDYTLNWINANI
jgi:alpha-beta hydrolase superfamily lysophospholipase